MQNRVKLPSGIATGSGPDYVSSGAKVTCAGMFCDKAPTHVLVFTTNEGKSEWWDAHCAPCLDQKIKPDAEVDAANNKDVLLGRTGGLNGYSDKWWSRREFTEQEAADIARIQAGELVETYLSPGVFAWLPPAGTTQTPASTEGA
ncbi:hypothetical protein AB0M10_15185 [Streptomyces sp. NPDC051840]|uniref:hypothetical protein n=1 Tax=Streptomyces sp. NPDC051840 TaxID=3154752 RepID=UPI00342A223D